MNIDMNNIRINHKGYSISLAQHEDLDTAKTLVQEIMVRNVKGNDTIYYLNNIEEEVQLENLIDVLKQAKKIIEKDIM